MTASNSSQPPAVLVDTCVISGLAKNDMKSQDAAAMIRMAEMVQRSELTIWASTVAREEIDKIPEFYRPAHVKQYDALKIIRASRATWVDTHPDSTGYGSVVQDPDFRAIRAVLKDENDARLVFQAKAGGVRDFVTVDYNSVLNRAADLRNLGVRAMSPAEYVNSRST